MNNLKKKIEKFVKNKKAFWSVMGTAIFLFVGLIVFVIGAYATGWNVLEWFISPMAVFFYFVIAVVILPIGIFLGIMYWSSKDDRRS